MERSVSLFRESGVSDIRVVVGHCRDQLKPLLMRLGVKIAINEHYEQGMFSSILSALESIGSDIENVFILPVDNALVRPRTIGRLLNHSGQYPGKILIPGFHGKGGHPVVIPSRFIPGIRKWHGEDGLKGALNQFAGEINLVAVADRNILFDMDTPEDYRECMERWSNYDIPSMEECEALLLDIHHVDERIYRHGWAVADTAGKLADILNSSGCYIDRERLRAAALLHDIAKGRPEHAHEAASILIEEGFPNVAMIIRSHMDINVALNKPVDCAELLYLADKSSIEDKSVTFSDRFRFMLIKYGHKPEVRKLIVQRLENAQLIKNKIEKAIRRPLE